MIWAVFGFLRGEKNRKKGESPSNNDPLGTHEKERPKSEIKFSRLCETSYSAEEVEAFRKRIAQYIPRNPFCAKAQLRFSRDLSKLVELKGPFHCDGAEAYWASFSDYPAPVQESSFANHVQYTNDELQGVLIKYSRSGPEPLIQKVQEAETRTLIRAWAATDFYARTDRMKMVSVLIEFRNLLQETILSRNEDFSLDEPRFVQTLESKIMIQSKAFFAWAKETILTENHVEVVRITLQEEEPVLELYDDGVLAQTYVLQNEQGDHFSGSILELHVFMGVVEDYDVPCVQMIGFIHAGEQEKTDESEQIYRFEVFFPACGGEQALRRYEDMRGQSLEWKGLKTPGQVMRPTVRLVGVCAACKKSFAFHGIAVYMANEDVAYSDDGLDMCRISALGFDPKTWNCEIEGKVFRYYNSFRCPHCGAPYLDYQAYPEAKKFGVLGCVHLGRPQYRSK